MSYFTGSPEFHYDTQPDSDEIALQIVGLIGVSILSSLYGIKTYNIQYTYLSYSKWLVLSLYICSWAFVFCGLPLALTNNGNFISCLLANIMCDVFYTGTKLIIYCWLIEKVWVVNGNRKSRLATKSYRFHMLLLTPYIGIFVLLITFHKARIEPNGICIIGLTPFATILLMVYDFMINLYMTILFVRPLMKLDKDTHMEKKTSRLKEVTYRTLIASVVCLVVSFANLCALTILKGEARGSLCLLCCYIDVVVNVAVIHMTTQYNSKTTHDLTMEKIVSENPNNNNKNNYNDILNNTLSLSNNLNSSNNTSSNGSNYNNIKYSAGITGEQYSEFGTHPWLTSPSASEYTPTHYMSATNTHITASPVMPYHVPSSNGPINHTYNTPPSLSTALSPPPINSSSKNFSPRLHHHFFNNNKFIMITEKEKENDSNNHHHGQERNESRSSSIDQSYSSKQSLT